MNCHSEKYFVYVQPKGKKKTTFFYKCDAINVYLLENLLNHNLRKSLPLNTYYGQFLNRQLPQKIKLESLKN